MSSHSLSSRRSIGFEDVVVVLSDVIDMHSYYPIYSLALLLQDLLGRLKFLDHSDIGEKAFENDTEVIS